MGFRKLTFGIVFGLILAVPTLAGIEALSAFYAPPWPARDLRSTALVKSPSLNSWGMRDSERTIAKPPNGPSRVVFVGDSFVESYPTPLSLPAAVEKRVAGSGGSIEAVNLGVSGTNPRSYYYRSRDVALKLSPDVLLLFIYAGNDFVAPDEGYSAWPSPVDESPGSSLLGKIMPRTDWVVINRLRLSDFLAHQVHASVEESTLLRHELDAPEAERVDRVTAHVRKFAHPDFSEEKIREVLGRGDGRLLRPADDLSGGSDYPAGWLLDFVTNTEINRFDVAGSRQDAKRLVSPGEIRATLSWIEAVDRVAHDHKVPLIVFVAPVGNGDPDYVDFWRPWPRFYAWNFLAEERHAQLVAALKDTKIRFADLRENLDGMPGTYRKLDGHWTQKGQAIVVERVKTELDRLLHQ